MALTNVENVLLIPGLAGNPNATAGYLQALVNSADRAIKSWLKREIEANVYTEFYDGNEQRDLVLKSFPVINDSNLAVYLDMAGYGGQSPNAFSSGTLQTQGLQYIIDLDQTPMGVSPAGQAIVSNRGLLRRIGGVNQGWIGYYMEPMYVGKLASYRMPCWPRGDLNIKVVYNAGYTSTNIPYDLTYACNMLVMYMIRNQPMGAMLGSENLGAYSYSILQMGAQPGSPPELGTIIRSLAPYRDSSW
jgi:hypothetical protein